MALGALVELVTAFVMSLVDLFGVTLAGAGLASDSFLSSSSSLASCLAPAFAFSACASGVFAPLSAPWEGGRLLAGVLPLPAGAADVEGRWVTGAPVDPFEGLSLELCGFPLVAAGILVVELPPVGSVVVLAPPDGLPVVVVVVDVNFCFACSRSLANFRRSAMHSALALPVISRHLLLMCLMAIFLITISGRSLVFAWFLFTTVVSVCTSLISDFVSIFVTSSLAPEPALLPLTVASEFPLEAFTSTFVFEWFSKHFRRASPSATLSHSPGFTAPPATF